MAKPFLAEIRVFSFNFPPKGWAFCNGQLLPINQNQALFALLGTMYGGNGQTTFALPDFRGKVPIHVGAGFTQGQAGGEQAERAAAAEGGVLRAGPLVIDTSKHEVTVDGETVRLTLTEFKLLAALVAARGRVLTRDQLMDKAMGTDVFVTDRAIDVHVTAIRKKLGTANWLIHTVRGVGYRLQETPEAGE